MPIPSGPLCNSYRHNDIPKNYRDAFIAISFAYAFQRSGQSLTPEQKKLTDKFVRDALFTLNILLKGFRKHISCTLTTARSYTQCHPSQIQVFASSPKLTIMLLNRPTLPWAYFESVQSMIRPLHSYSCLHKQPTRVCGLFYL